MSLWRHVIWSHCFRVCRYLRHFSSFFSLHFTNLTRLMLGQVGHHQEDHCLGNPKVQCSKAKHHANRLTSLSSSEAQKQKCRNVLQVCLRAELGPEESLGVCKHKEWEDPSLRFSLPFPAVDRAKLLRGTTGVWWLQNIQVTLKGTLGAQWRTGRTNLLKQEDDMKESRLDGEHTSKAAGILKNLADGQRMTWGINLWKKTCMTLHSKAT